MKKKIYKRGKPRQNTFILTRCSSLGKKKRSDLGDYLEIRMLFFDEESLGINIILTRFFSLKKTYRLFFPVLRGVHPNLEGFGGKGK